MMNSDVERFENVENQISIQDLYCLHKELAFSLPFCYRWMVQKYCN